MSARPNLTRNQSLVFDTLDGADKYRNIGNTILPRDNH